MIGEDGIDCPFCKRIKASEYDYMFLGSKEGVVTFEPLNPVTPGHRLFVPVNHQSPYYSSSLETSDLLTAFARWTAFYKIDRDYNLIINAGALASQTVEHTHLHYVPRRENDGLILPWTNQVSH